MKKRNLQLRTTVLAVMITLLLGVAGMMKSTYARSSQEWIAWEQEQNYLFYLVFADVQAHETEMPGWPATNEIRFEQLPFSEYVFQMCSAYNYLQNPNYTWLDDYYLDYNITEGWLGLAKNEKTGFQIFYREQEKPRNIRIEVSNFVNSTGDVLSHSVYFEEFFISNVYPNDSMAEALVPYRNELKGTAIDHNKMFYVELNAAKDQPTGTYTSTITLYEDNVVLASKTVYAKVWNFALPESHYSEVVMGLHNCNSGYGATQNFLVLNGVNMNNGEPESDADKLLAKQILSGYHEFLLDHGISTYEIPRWLIDDDPKAAELTMADPRRKVFSVPVNYSHLNGSVFNQTATNLIAQYSGIVYENPFLKDKAFFYSKDEPKNANDFAVIDQFCSVLSNYWPGYHAVAPFYTNNNQSYEQVLEYFGDNIDILCPNQQVFNPWNGMDAEAIDVLLDNFKNQTHTWRYPGDNLCGGVNFRVHPLLSVGTMRRILFWQQYAVNSDGILYWNCAYLPNNWQKKVFPASGGIQTGNGDGILLFPGAPFDEDVTVPIASLRLKQLALGINDYDYLRLTEEFLGEETAQSRLRGVFYNMDTHLCYIFNKETGFSGWTSYDMNRTRYFLGQALSDAANTEHDWGEWQIAVLPDETHCGIEIRTCSHCGTQESRLLAITNHWTPDNPGNYSLTMPLTAVIQIDSVEQYSNLLEVGAFCGSECRGSQVAAEFFLTNRYLVQLNVFGEIGDELTFKLYDHSLGQELNLASPGPLVITEDGYGTPTEPYALNFLSIYEISATADPEEAGTVTGAGQYNNGTTCTLTAETNEGFQFDSWTRDGEVVSTNPEYEFTVTESAAYVAHFSYVHTQALTEGWNWYSTYIEQDGIDGLTMLENSLDGNGLRIQAKTGSTDYFEFQGTGYWCCILNAMVNEQMYKIRTSAECEAVVTGSLASVESHPITINEGWSWIGYPVNQTQSVETALSGFTPEANDMIKGRNGYTTYISYGGNNLWYGTLNTLEPGQGYMYKSNSSTTKTLTFQAGRGEEVVANVTNENNFFTPNDAEFPSNMLVTAVIDMGGQELRSGDYELAAFAGDECRGSVKLMYVEPFDRYEAFLLVYGNGSETLRFVLTDGTEASQSDDHILYESDGIVGTASEPVTLHFGPLGVEDDSFLPVNIYPNPSKGIFNLEGFGLQKVEVMDAQGQVILSQEVENDFLQINLSDKARGAYLLRVVTTQGITTKKVLVTE